MPEPVTIIAGVLSIVNGTITATKTLLDFIDSIRNAPKLVFELRRDVESTKSIIQAIEDLVRPMEDSVEGIPADLRACFSSTDHTLEDCKVVTEEFETKLKKWFKDSAWDRLKPTFKDAEIERFRTRLRDTRDVLNLNLKVCTMYFHPFE
ncbi:hypothetical protein IQ07DRAFT_226322 [Pyrenochaeta sp. DS3sAY3a]|nr:hypothetical protein IQ07DRAFT_226322 [Pyrenochaeta sp. DS3sAY3a]